MTRQPLSVITGAFGYTGKYIARRLLDRGAPVRTLTRSASSGSPFGDRVEARSLDFGDFGQLVANLQGCKILYNTYWIRFARGPLDHNVAVENSRILIRAAVAAGVRRLMHISITNASEASPLPYFRGKGLVEQAIRDSGLSYAIIRPTVLFSNEDVLINNIAWFLRRSPLFPIAGPGDYLIQPVFVDDVAKLAVEAGAKDDNTVLDAVGPEVFRFDELVRLIGRRVGAKARLVHVPPEVALAAARVAGLMLRDVVLTRDELDGLMADNLVSAGPPTAPTSFSRWVEADGAALGKRYASELARHYGPRVPN